MSAPTTGTFRKKSVRDIEVEPGQRVLEVGTGSGYQTAILAQLADRVYSIDRIAERTVPRSEAVIQSNGPVRATLELAAGTAERLGIRVGDKVEQRIFGNS